MASIGPSPPAVQEGGASYSSMVGSVYVFNLMLGSGLLALPKAFIEVGWVLGLVGLLVLAFMSYCTVTFVIEAQAVHNALAKTKKKNKKVCFIDLYLFSTVCFDSFHISIRIHDNMYKCCISSSKWTQNLR